VRGAAIIKSSMVAGIIIVVFSGAPPLRTAPWFKIANARLAPRTAARHHLLRQRVRCRRQNKQRLIAVR